MEALGMLYDIYIDDLFTYGRKFSADKCLVMDCIHDLFLNLYKYRRTLSLPARVDFYLMHSLKNEIVRRIQSSRIEMATDQTQISLLQIAPEESLLSDDLEIERSQKLAKAIKMLSKKQRTGLSLRFNDNHSYEEIATVMNISVQSSRTMIYRAIKALRKQMQFFILF
ncbi:MAG: sigma-70 family RNA polymerase sigma factor [Flavobacteriaceae bacterium]|nr:sigma-70 family RNA polymerase sigma factor [Flavobacteriaceae bacterium]